MDSAAAARDIEAKIRDLVIFITGDDAIAVEAASPLVGEGALVDSQGLLEIMLALEEFAGERFGKAFDWMNDAAFSSSRSPFRTVGTLAAYMAAQMADGA
ncbi:MAG: acyl carrier protein [Phreatobacter sp.]|nr:acyl carrier protein [Phreatobacter sp.]